MSFKSHDKNTFMNMKHFSNQILLQNAKQKAAQVREATTELLWLLREIESRKAFAEIGFSSLFEYVVKELGHSEASAMKRIGAMRLLKEMPEIEQSLNEGRLNLSQASTVQRFFKNEKHDGKIYSLEAKKGLLKKIENTSTRETEKILIQLSPDSMPKHTEKLRPISEDISELKILIPSGLLGAAKAN